MEKLTIGKVAKQAQVRIETLRYYERMGLVAPPPRNGSHYRLYPEETVRRVQFIKRAQQLGFSLKEITALLELRATPDTPCADIRTRALAKINDIEAKMRALHAMKRALTQLVEECPGQGLLPIAPYLHHSIPRGKRTTERIQRWQRNERLKFSVRDALPVKRL